MVVKTSLPEDQATKAQGPRIIKRRVGNGQNQFSLTLRVPSPEEVSLELSQALETFKRRLGAVVSWSNVRGEGGKQLDYDPELMDRILDSDPEFAELVAQTLQAHFQEAARKHLNG